MRNHFKLSYISLCVLLCLSLASCTNMYDPEAERESLASVQASLEQESREQASREQESREQASREQESREQESREQASREQESMEQESREQESAAQASSEYEEIDGYQAPENWRKLYPNGSAGRLEGTVVVISIFAGVIDQSWDFNIASDYEAYSTAYYNLKYACEFLEKESADYGKTTNFIWDWMEYNDLYYKGDITTSVSDILADNDAISKKTWKFIEGNINSENLRKKYQADSVIYMVYLNAPEGNTQPSCTRDFYTGMPYPYEICYMQMRNSQGLSVPAVFAHEMLHTFGAPDLYWTDSYSVFELSYGITKEYTDYIKKNRLNDIMRITWDPQNGKYVSDAILQDITDITAYYVGLTDESETVTKWGFEKSQHVE